MTDLTPITALGAKTARKETYDALTLSENPELALASLALRRDQTPPSPFGLRLPDPGHCADKGSVAAFWTTPGQWMIEAPGRANEDFAARLEEEVPGGSISEQTDAWTAIEITAKNSAALEALMQKLVNLDPAQIAPGHAARTGLEHMSVYLIRRSETHLAVMGMRSFAAALWHALVTAAARIDQTA